VKACILGVSYIPFNTWQRTFKGYHHDTNYPKLIALVAIKGNKEVVCIGSAIRLALGDKKKLPKGMRDLVIQNHPDQIDVVPKQDSAGETYYEITPESAREWVEKIMT